MPEGGPHGRTYMTSIDKTNKFIFMADGNSCVNIEKYIYVWRSPVNICNHLKPYIYPNSILNSKPTSEIKDKLDKIRYGNKLDHYILESNEASKYRDWRIYRGSTLQAL